MAALALISLAATVASAAIAAQGTIAAGKAQQAAADYEAKQMDVKAKDEQAASQREAEQYKRNKELALSKLQAGSAASGFSATDPTALALADEISRYGTYQEQMAMYGGAAKRSDLEAQAAGRRYEGKSASKAARTSALGTIIGGFGSAFSKFGSSYGSMSSTPSYRYGY